MSNTQIVVGLIGAILGSNVLAVLVTLYFTRRKTAAEARAKDAEAHHSLADAHKSDAEASGLYVEQIRSALGDLRGTVTAWNECMKQNGEQAAQIVSLKAENETKKQAAEAANREAEMLRRERDELRWKYEPPGAVGRR